MWTWSDFDRAFSPLDLFRRFDRLFQELEGHYPESWPRAALADVGHEFVVTAEVPGLAQKDLQLSVTQDALAVTGERKPDAPEGYSTHRRERPTYRFSRSFSFPAKVDVEKVSATVKNGILTVKLAKAAEAQPRQITVKAS